MGTITLKFLVEVKLIILKNPCIAPWGDDNRQPELYVCESPGFNTGFLPITPSPSTISLELSESKISQCLEINCTESLLWFSMVMSYEKAKWSL